MVDRSPGIPPRKGLARVHVHDPRGVARAQLGPESLPVQAQPRRTPCPSSPRAALPRGLAGVLGKQLVFPRPPSPAALWPAAHPTPGFSEASTASRPDSPPQEARRTASNDTVLEQRPTTLGPQDHELPSVPRTTSGALCPPRPFPPFPSNHPPPHDRPAHGGEGEVTVYLCNSLATSGARKWNVRKPGPVREALWEM